MTNTQLIFSLGSGMALMVAGLALAVSGIADWGLFWTGAIVSSLTMATQLRQRGTSATFKAARLQPATARVDH